MVFANHKKPAKTSLGVLGMSWFWLFVLCMSVMWMVVTNAQYLH
jgi:hypothetical protein